MRILSEIYLIIFSLFCFSVSFTDIGEAIPNIILLVCFCLFPFVVKKGNCYKRNLIPFYIFLALLALLIVQSFFLNRLEDLKFIEKILLIPAIYLLSKPIKKKKIPIFAFLAGTFMIMSISAFNVLDHITQTKSFTFSVGSHINEILMGDRPYVGFLYVLSICLCLFLGFNNPHKTLRVLFLFLALIFSFYIVLIAARLSIASLLLILLSSLFFIKNKKIKVPIVLVGFVLLPGILFFNPNIKDRFFMGFEQKEGSIHKILKMEPRSHIWSCSIIVGNDNSMIFFGSGFKNSQDLLVNCYKYKPNFLNDEQRNWFVKSRFNTHNQFLNFYLSSGIFVLTIFSFLFFYLFKTFINSFFTFSIVLSLFLFCFIENVLSRQMGCAVFGISLIFCEFLMSLNKSESS